MCVVSMVHDHFEKKIPWDWQPMPWIPNEIPVPNIWTFTLPDDSEKEALRAEVARLTKIVEDFKAAKAAAETVDRLTNQPDCIDPKKATLIERVNDLEKRLAEVKREIGM